MTSKPEPDLSGLAYGSYHFERTLGEGGYGLVALFKNSLGKKRAVKLLRPELLQNDDAVRRFLNEAKITARIDHPNVVEVEDVVTIGGRPAIIMEYLEGESLFALLRRERRLDVSRAAPILLDVCDAVGAAHEQGVVHRDLKPENIHLHQSRGQIIVKVLDFGIAKLLGDDIHRATRRTQTGQVIGTAAYMSPEQVLGRSDIDVRTDVYAMGIITFEVLTGVFPFRAESLTQWAIAHAGQAPRPIRELRPDLYKSWGTLLDIALAKKPEARFATMNDFAAGVRAAMNKKRVVGPAPVPIRVTTTRTPDEPLPMKGRTLPLAPAISVGPRGTRKLPDAETPPPDEPRADSSGAATVVPSAAAETATPGPIPVSVAAPNAQTGVLQPEAPIATLPAAVHPDGIPTAVHDEPITPIPPHEIAGPPTLPPLTGNASTAAPSATIPPTQHRPAWIKPLLIGSAAAAVLLVLVWILSRPGAKTSAANEPPDAALASQSPMVDAAAAQPRMMPPDASPPEATAIDAGAPDATGAPAAPRRNTVVHRRTRRKGVVKLKVTPWADVYVDGRKIGNAPTTLRLPVGRHSVLLVNETAGRRERLRIHVRADKPVIVTRRW